MFLFSLYCRNDSNRHTPWADALFCGFVYSLQIKCVAVWIFLKVSSQEDEESLDSKYIFSTWNICSSLSFPKFELDPRLCFYGFSSCCQSYFDYKQTFQFSCFCASSIVLSLILGFSSSTLWSWAREILKGKANSWCLLIFNFTVLRQKYQKH